MGLLGASAPAAAGAFDLLETTVLASSASSVTFSGLGAYSDYKHLQIRWVAKSTANNQDHLKLTFNGSSASSYVDHNLNGDGSAVSSNASSPSQTYIRLLFANAYSGAPGFASGVMDVLDFSSASKNTTIRSLHGYQYPVQRTRIVLSSGAWFNTTAVTSLTLTAFSDQLAANSRFSLYGIKG